jgi:hypothetical protein
MLAHLRSPAFLLNLIVLTGCAVGPDYRPPEIALSIRFLGQEGVEHREVQSTADLQTWWAAFDDPLLARFVTLALEQNLDIAQAAARVAQSRASLRQADAALLPSANVSAHSARVYQSAETPLGQVLDATPDFDRSGSAYGANLDVGWEIDTSAACGEGGKPHARSTRHPKPAPSRQGWPWPRKRRMCTSRSGACRRASRSPGSKLRPAGNFSPWSRSCTKRGSLPSSR